MSAVSAVTNYYLYVLGEYPVGLEVEYDGRMGKLRITSEEKRAIERSKYEDYNDARRAAEAHRQVTCNTLIWCFHLKHII